MEQLLEEYQTDSGNRETTDENYYGIWKNFNHYLLLLDRMPTTWEEKVTLYCAHLIKTGIKSTTLKSYVSAIKSILKSIKYYLNVDKMLMTALTKTCKSKNDRVISKLPIKKGLLSLLIMEVQQKFSKINQPYLELLYKTILLLGYYGMLRISEMTKTKSGHAVKAKNIHSATNKNKILIVLYSSKTHGNVFDGFSRLGSGPELC